MGLEFAKVFASNKHNLILVSRREKLLKELKKELEKKHEIKVIIIKEDLSDIKSSYRIKEKLKDKKINVLVNNAGFGDKSLFAKADIKKTQNMVNLNVTTLTLLTRLFIGGLIKTRGKILNVASVAAFQPGPMMSVYYATKAYVLSFSEGLAEELKGKVKVSCLCPGATRTEFEKVAKTNFKGNIPTAKEVTIYGYDCLNKGKVVAVHGLLFRILVQLNRILPRSAIRKISYKVTKGL